MSELLTILESYGDRLTKVSEEWTFEHRGWTSQGLQNTSKCIPYGDDVESLFQIQEIGCLLYYSCPIIRSATEKFISYVVSSGHTYDLSMRAAPPKSQVKGTTQVSDSMLEEMKWCLDWTLENCYPGGWLSLQEETVRRYLREGEVFRRIFKAADGLQVRFIEPFQIRNKAGGDLKEVKNSVMGVVHDEGDASVVTGYWYLANPSAGTITTNFQLLEADKVQHVKYGVDGNDPRGCSPFPMVRCNSDRARIIDIAMNELALTQSSYAVIRQYENAVTATAMRRIAEGHRAADEVNGNTIEFGKEIDARGFTYEFPSMGIDPDRFIAIIDQHRRAIASVLDMPDFMILSSGGGGSRATAVAAEGPFARRVAREQIKISLADTKLLWSGISQLMGWTPEQEQSIRRMVRLTPSMPVPYTKDVLKDTQAVAIQVKEKLISRQTGTEKLGNSWELNLREMEAEHESNVFAPPPVMAGAVGPDGKPVEPVDGKPIKKATKDESVLQAKPKTNPTAGSARG